MSILLADNSGRERKRVTELLPPSPEPVIRTESCSSLVQDFPELALSLFHPGVFLIPRSGDVPSSPDPATFLFP
ncbi:KH homology domain-containing protein 4 [Clarias magur]|uniref:KH homology domain-containing protein 4 n=1 Tax=Clarias magur TaxID=1594786 RepID=A0A8J4WSC2_CLAMG|nr:KH homology domain-containing protein 4 [Clarias magur]